MDLENFFNGSKNLLKKSYHLYHTIPLVRVLCSFSLLFLLFLSTSRAVSKNVESLPQFKAQSNLSQIKGPSWLSEKATEELKSISMEHNLLSPDLVSRVGSTLEKLPLIQEIREIRREFPAQIALKIALREPVAWIEWKKQKWFLDGDGHLIPAFYYVESLKKPQIVGFNGDITSQKTWRKIVHGISVASEMHRSAGNLAIEIATIDVGNVDGVKDPRESEIVLTTSSQASIEWGRASISSSPIKVSLEEKISNLKKILLFDPGLLRIKIARLHFGKDALPIVLRPLPKPPENR